MQHGATKRIYMYVEEYVKQKHKFIFWQNYVKCDITTQDVSKDYIIQ